jgi:integrase
LVRNKDKGLSKAKRQEFINANPLVKDWLRNKAPATQNIFAFNFIRFFQWAQQKYGFESLDAMLKDHEESRRSESIQQRKRHARILKEHALDNPEFSELGDQARALIITTVSSFYNYCELPLTTSKGEFKLEIYAKYDYRQPGLDDARKIIDAAPQREKVIYLLMLQGGLRIGDLLNYINYRWAEIKPQLDARKDPIKLTMFGGKYWTYITTDAIHELKKYIIQRGEPKAGEPIFISKGGKSVSPVYVADVLQRICIKLGLILPSEIVKLREGHRYPIKLHQFRKLFKSESSVAGRGFDSRYGEFFMGHAGGLAQIGGVYDKSPELHEGIFEQEYRKLAPYLNIFTGIQTLEARIKEDAELKAELGPEILERLRKRGLQFRRGKNIEKQIAEFLNETKHETEEQDPKDPGDKKSDCEDGVHCPEFKQVAEEELLKYLQDGWRIEHNLVNGQIIIRRE